MIQNRVIESITGTCPTPSDQLHKLDRTSLRTEEAGQVYNSTRLVRGHTNNYFG